MNILIVANHYPVCSARYATEAFERLGHTVKHIGPQKGRDIWGLRLPKEYEWIPNVTIDAQHINEDMTREIQECAFILVMDSDPFILDTVNGMNRPIIVWGVDNHVRDYRREWFDHYFLAHRKVSVIEWENPAAVMLPPRDKTSFIMPSPTIPNLTLSHLPCCYDPIQHTPSPIPWEEREYDVAILGMMYPQRMQAVKELKEAGLKVIWGCGAVGDTYRDLHHQSRIALNLSFKGDVGQRVMETAAMGCVVMSDNCPDYELLKPEGVWLIEDGKPLAEQVQAILSDPEHAQLMVRLAQTWAKDETWDNRAQTIVEWYEREKIHETA